MENGISSIRYRKVQVLALKSVWKGNILLTRTGKSSAIILHFILSVQKMAENDRNFKAIVLSIIKLNSNSSSTSTFLSLYLEINMTYTLHTQSI